MKNFIIISLISSMLMVAEARPFADQNVADDVALVQATCFDIQSASTPLVITQVFPPAPTLYVIKLVPYVAILPEKVFEQNGFKPLRLARLSKGYKNNPYVPPSILNKNIPCNRWC
jgi:hypothetical protein